MKKEIKETIELAFAELQEACSQYDDKHGGWGAPATRMLDRVVTVAAQQERKHRAACGGGARYGSPVDIAARYFAVRACQEDYRHLSTRDALAHVATLREDYQIGALLGALLVGKVRFPAMTAGFRGIDYSKDLV